LFVEPQEDGANSKKSGKLLQKLPSNINITKRTRKEKGSYEHGIESCVIFFLTVYGAFVVQGS
jgi:hypothetical protein